MPLITPVGTKNGSRPVRDYNVLSRPVRDNVLSETFNISTVDETGTHALEADDEETRKFEPPSVVQKKSKIGGTNNRRKTNKKRKTNKRRKTKKRGTKRRGTKRRRR